MTPHPKRKLIATILIAIAAITGFTMTYRRSQAHPLPDCPPGRPIIIDPGHGGIDGGTNIPGMLEKDVVLDIALRTKQYLDRNKVPVVLTRETDTALGGPNDSGRLRRDLNYRIKVANHCQAGLMLSLHVNSARNPAEQGIMILYQPTRAGRDAARLFDDILRRWPQPLHQRKEDPIPRRDLAVLKTRAPALLVELGFITHPTDRERLADSAYREQVAQALASACGAIYQQWLK